MNTRQILVGASLVSATLLASLAAGLLSLRRTAPFGPAPHATPSVMAPALAPIEDRTPEIRGRILDADGRVAAGAAVRLISTSRPYDVYREATTDAAGAFSFAHVGGWRTRVVADHGIDGVVSSAVLHVGPGQSMDVTLVLSAAGAVRGTVVDAQQRPLAGAVVSVEGLLWIVSSTSDTEGAFRLTTVPDEATSLLALARGYRSAHASLGTRDERTELVVRVVLIAASPVHGEVRDDDGNPTSARVVACEDQASEARTESAADGTFELPASTIGCDAVAEHANYAASNAAAIVEGGHLLLRLRAGGAIEGRVVDERGANLSPFTIGIESFAPARGRAFDRRGAKTFDDPSGAFRWDKLSPGSYVLTASATGKAPGAFRVD